MNKLADPATRHPYCRQRLGVIATFAAAVTLLVVFVFMRGAPGRHFLNAYQQLQIGMPKAQVTNLFAGRIAYRCRCGQSEIVYYAGQNWWHQDFPSSTPPAGTVVKQTKLRDVFDHLQVAFDSTDRLIAYTWIGETYAVEYVGGSVQGSHFKLLPPGTL